MNIQVAQSATQFEKDDRLFDETHTRSQTELLAVAAKRSGQSTFALGRDFLRHSRTGRLVEMADYVRHSLWDTARHGADGALRFVGAKAHWPIVNTVNDERWFNVAEDKLVMSAMVDAAGLPQPETLATIDRTARRHGELGKIATATELRDLATSHPGGSLFLKTVGGMVGQGAMVVEAADAETITATGNEPMAYDAFLDKVIGPRSYLVQKRMENHPDIAPFLSGIATIRFPNFMRDDGPLIPCVAMKLPSSGNVTCAYWRPGNLAAEIDAETGLIVRLAHRDGPFSDEIPDHPERPGLVGLKLPFWNEARALNDAVARLFAPISYNSTDIALTPDGPVLVEANYGGSFDILQNATGRGLLTDAMKTWFLERGVDFDGSKKKKSGIRRLF